MGQGCRDDRTIVIICDFSQKVVLKQKETEKKFKKIRIRQLVIARC